MRTVSSRSKNGKRRAVTKNIRSPPGFRWFGPGSALRHSPDWFSFPCLSVLFHDQLAAQHSHLALKTILARFVGCEFQRHLFTFWQVRVLIEIGEQDFFGTRRTFLPRERQSHGASLLHNDHIGCVAAFDGDRHFLRARLGYGNARLCFGREPEIPGDENR